MRRKEASWCRSVARLSRRWRSFPGSIERMGSRSDHQQEAEPLRLRSPFRFDNGTRRQAQMPHAAFRQECAPCSDAMQVANPSNEPCHIPCVDTARRDFGNNQITRWSFQSHNPGFNTCGRALTRLAPWTPAGASPQRDTPDFGTSRAGAERSGTCEAGGWRQ